MHNASGVRCSHCQAAVTKHREHGRIVCKHISFELCDSIFSRDMSQVMQQTACDPAACIVFFDNERDLCAAAARGVPTQPNDSLLRSRPDCRQQDNSAYTVDLCELPQLLLAQLRFRVKEAGVDRTGLKSQEGFENACFVVWTN